MSEKTYQWLVDRREMDEKQGETKVEVVQDGIELRLERLAFGQYAAIDMSYVKTEAPFKIVPTDTSHGRSAHTISFLIGLSGRSTGKMPGLGEFVIDPEWGMLTDYSEGQAEFYAQPGDPIRTLGGTLTVEQIKNLFRGEGFDAELKAITEKRGSMKSFLVTPAMRQIVNNAISTPLIGPLKRLFLEGAALQLFALIFQHELVEPVTGHLQSTQVMAHKKAVEKAARMLLEDLTEPPGIIALSGATGLSQRKLSQGFKALYGCSMLELLTRKRLQTARELLTDRPDYPLKALTQDVGYKHPSNFITAFKREFGMTPGEFVKTVKGHPRS